MRLDHDNEVTAKAVAGIADSTSVLGPILTDLASSAELGFKVDIVVILLIHLLKRYNKPHAIMSFRRLVLI